MTPRLTARERYQTLSIKREPFLRRAREASKYTIPSLVPPDGFNGTQDLTQPWQSLGARCVNNLAAALNLALLPPTRRPFRLRLTSKIRSQIADDQYGEWEEALARYEQRISEDIESSGTRVQINEALKHLQVAGTVALYYGPSATRVFPLYQFVCRRAPEGDVQEIIVVELISEEQIPESIRPQVIKGKAARTSSTEKTFELYTVVERDGEVFQQYQELEGVRVPDSEGVWQADDCPWSVPRWIRIDGEDYGRGHVEEHLGDLKTFEGLSRSITIAAGAAAKVIFMAKPSGMTNVDDLVAAESGDFVEGDKEDVGVLGLEKFGDFQIAKDVMQGIQVSLAASFLLNSALRRDAERVTAEEIRMLIQELENSLGGVWSIMTIELLLPMIRSRMATMQRTKKVPTLPKGTAEPVVVTGVDALGRANELQRLDSFVQRIATALGPQAVPQFLNVTEYLKRAAAAEDIEPKGLIKTEEQISAETQQANQMALAQKAAGPAIKLAGDIAAQKHQFQAADGKLPS